MKIITCLPGEQQGFHLYCTLTANVWYFSLILQEIESVVGSLLMICTPLLPCFNMGHAQTVIQMRKTRSALTPSTKLYSPHSSVTHENKLPWIPICHTLSSSNLSLKWTKQRFPSGQPPITQFAWWPFALWLLLNEVSKICIVLGRKHLKSLSKESLAPPHYYTIVQFKIHHLTYCSIYLICSPALSM